MKKNFSEIVMPVLICASVFSSCIPAADIEYKLDEIERRLQRLEQYKNIDAKKLEKKIEENTANIDEMNKSIVELMRRTSIVGEQLEEEKIEENR